MSTILKALKKLEDEKRAAVPVNLAARIVAESSSVQRSSQSARLIAAGATGGLLLAVALICGWFWLRSADPDGGPVKVAESAPPAPLALVAAPAPASEQPASNAKGPAADASSRSVGNAAEPYRTAAPALSQARLTVTTPRQPLPPPPTVIVPPRLAATTPPPHQTPPAEVDVIDRQLPPPGQQWSTPHLVVTEIFPPSAGSGWMAVVNGLPVMDGTMVEGAVVEEIHADRVLFLIQGKIVAVPLK
jgi:general secretion pathway protein B